MSDIGISSYERRTFRVEGIRVTGSNMQEVAEWCGGAVKESRPTGYAESYPYVEVVVGHVASRTQLARATVGMWITRLTKDNNFRVYKARSFAEAFQEILSEEEKRGKIQTLVEELMHVAKFGDEESNSDEAIAKEFAEHFMHVLD